jgi:nucleoid-associated protein YgaU
MARTRVRPGRLAALAGAVLLTVLLVSGAASGRAEAPAGGSGGEVHVVAEGDTLWDIARSVVGPEGDPRPVVEEIRELNDLGTSSTLLPGVRLAVPRGLSLSASSPRAGSPASP